MSALAGPHRSFRGTRAHPAWRAAALGVISAISGVAVLAVSGWLIVRAAERPPVLGLLTAIVVVRALGLVRSVGRYGERLVGHDVALRRLADRRVAWYRRLAGRAVPGGAGDADLLSRFSSDVDDLRDRDLRVRQPAVVAAATTAAAVPVAALLLPSAGAALLGGALVAGLAAPSATWALGRRAARRQAADRALLAERLDEALAFGPTLALHGLSSERRAALARASDRLGRGDRAAASAAALGGALGALGAGGALIAVLLLAGRATAEGRLAPVALGALVLLAVGLHEVLRPLPEAALRLVAVRGAEERLAAAVAGPARPTVEEDAATGPPALPARGVLRAWDLRHRPGGPRAALVLDGVDLDVAPGERIAIVGPSGAGKSTLAALLTRVEDPDGGVVSYGGVSLRDVPVAELRDRVRLAGQDAHLLAGTLAANLRIGAPDAADAALRAVLGAVGLGPWLAALPDGLETLVGEEGATVSGGQRQRIAVARALLSPADVLVLDEPTAMLDGESAAALAADAVRAADGRAVVVVTHDAALLPAVDRVLELRDGRLEPVGPPAPASGAAVAQRLQQ